MSEIEFQVGSVVLLYIYTYIELSSLKVIIERLIVITWCYCQLGNKHMIEKYRNEII